MPFLKSEFCRRSFPFVTGSLAAFRLPCCLLLLHNIVVENGYVQVMHNCLLGGYMGVGDVCEGIAQGLR